MQQYFSKNRNGEVLELNESDKHHIKNVMRMKTGDNIVVVYEKNKYLCEINLENMSVYIKNELVSDNELGLKISIAQGLIREHKLDTV